MGNKWADKSKLKEQLRDSIQRQLGNHYLVQIVPAGFLVEHKGVSILCNLALMQDVNAISLIKNQFNWIFP